MAPLSYQWLFNGVPVSAGTNATLVLTNIQPADAGGYSVRLANSFGEVTSAAAFLTVITTPAITSQPGNRTANAGVSTSFFVAASGAPPLSYQWRFNGNDLPGATNQSLLLSNVQDTNAGLYSARVTNIYGSAISSNATLRVITIPEFNFQPVSTSVLAGTNVTFSVSASGPGPLRYQWRFNSNDLAGATSSILTLSNVQPANAGFYSVRVTNNYGAAFSTNALLTVIAPVDDGTVFQILSLTTNGAAAIECNNQTGDDRGGIAVSTNLVLLTGDSATARFSATDLSGATGLGRVLDSLCANLRTETIYSLSDGTNLIASPGGIVASLWELNPTTGLTNGVRINLSRTINVSGNSGNIGIFSGYDEIVLYANGRGYKIALPTGQVTEVGAISSLSHQFTESWAYWGVAEHLGGFTYVVYARDSQTIVRTRFPDNLTTTVLSLASAGASLADMASFTVSVPRMRWYFHHENTSVFRSGDETIGYASATFSVNTGTNADHFEWSSISAVQAPNQPFAVTLTARNSTNALAPNFNGVVTLSGLSVAGGPAVPVAPTTISNFVNGVWTGMVSVLQSSSNMVLRADDRRGVTGNSGAFSVAPANDLFVTLASTSNPVLVAQPLDYTITIRNTGPSPAAGVKLTNTLPASVTFISATPSQGLCTNSGSLVICDLGTIGSNATVSLVVVPAVVGAITNRATVTRGELDATLTNNTATLVTQVVLPTLSIADIVITEGNSGTNDAFFTVTLSQAVTNTVSVSFATGGGSASGTGANADYVARTGVLTFAPGETSQTIAIGIRGDRLYENTETFNLTLNSPVNATLARSQASGTIQNDDALPTISVSDVTVTEGDSGTKLANFQVVLSAQSGVLAIYNFTTSNGTAVAGSDYVARGAAFGFVANTTTLTQNVAITINGDPMICYV